MREEELFKAPPVGLCQRLLLFYCRPRSRPWLLTVWEEDTAACGWRRIFLAVAGFDISTIVVTSLFGIMAVIVSSFAIMTMTAFSFAIKIDSSLVLISLRLASLGGTPIPTTTGTPMVIPLMTTDQVTITSIGPLWPCQCSLNLPDAAITMALLTG